MKKNNRQSIVVPVRSMQIKEQLWYGFNSKELQFTIASNPFRPKVTGKAFYESRKNRESRLVIVADYRLYSFEDKAITKLAMELLECPSDAPIELKWKLLETGNYSALANL